MRAPNLLSFLSERRILFIADFPEDVGDDGIEGRYIDFKHVYSKLPKLAVLL